MIHLTMRMLSLLPWGRSWAMLRQQQVPPSASTAAPAAATAAVGGAGRLAVPAGKSAIVAGLQQGGSAEAVNGKPQQSQTDHRGKGQAAPLQRIREIAADAGKAAKQKGCENMVNPSW